MRLSNDNSSGAQNLERIILLTQILRTIALLLCVAILFGGFALAVHLIHPAGVLHAVSQNEILLVVTVFGVVVTIALAIFLLVVIWQ